MKMENELPRSKLRGILSIKPEGNAPYPFVLNLSKDSKKRFMVDILNSDS